MERIKKYWKNYLYSLSPENRGIWFLFNKTLFVAALIFIFGVFFEQYIIDYIGCAFVVFAFGFPFIMYFVRKKYIVSCDKVVADQLIFIRVVDNKVVESGQTVWNEGEIYRFILPEKYTNKSDTTWSFSYIYKSESNYILVGLSVLIYLQILPEIDYQDVFDKVFKGKDKEIVFFSEYVVDTIKEMVKQQKLKIDELLLRYINQPNKDNMNYYLKSNDRILSVAVLEILEYDESKLPKGIELINISLDDPKRIMLSKGYDSKI